jgi:hypothetical protein
MISSEQIGYSSELVQQMIFEAKQWRISSLIMICSTLDLKNSDDDLMSAL